MIEVSGLNKSFGNLKVLQHLDLKIERGEVVSIIGPSGCGKTTLLRCVTGLDKIFSGQIKIEGLLNFDYLKNNRIAVVLQKFSNFSWLTVKENIMTAFIHENYKPKSEQELISLNLISELHLENFSNSYISQLSGGMQQRVAVARAIAQNSDIIALDEPFGALDIINRNKLQILFKELNTKFNKTVLFVTHDIEEAIFMSDRVCLLSKAPSCVKKEYFTSFKKNLNIDAKYNPSFVELRKEIEFELSE